MQVSAERLMQVSAERLMQVSAERLMQVSAERRPCPGGAQPRTGTTNGPCSPSITRTRTR
jgi:hypothetical protein